MGGRGTAENDFVDGEKVEFEISSIFDNSAFVEQISTKLKK